MDDISRFLDAWDQCGRGAGDGWHDEKCKFFASAQGPYVLQANIRKMHMALQDRSLPQDMIESLEQCVRLTEQMFTRPQDMYVRSATWDLRNTYVTLAKRMSSLTLYPEVTWRNIGLCASCLGMDAIRLGQWYQSAHPMPGQTEDSVLADMHTHRVLDGLTLSDRLEDLTWWELTAKTMARH